LEVALSVTGMDINEATALMRGMQPGARWNGVATKPAIGGLRYAVEITGLSIAGAEAMAGALAAHTHAVQESVNLGDHRRLTQVAPNGCDDCSVEPGETHRYPSCPGNRGGSE
jgi:hypothetical protein